jgi:membrane protease YdiL (CAAX protease family)
MNPGPSRPQALLEVLLCSGYPTQVLIGLGLGLAGLRPDKDGTPTLALLSSLAGLDTVLLVWLVLALLARAGESPRQVLFGSRSIGFEVLRGFVLVPWVFAIVVGVALTIARWAPQLIVPNPLASLASTWPQYVVFAITVIFAGGLREEVQRAFILHRCEQRLGGAAVGVMVWGLIFGFGHYFVQGWSAAIITGLLGIFWNLVYLARRSVVAPMVSHASFNLIEVIGFGLAR